MKITEVYGVREARARLKAAGIKTSHEIAKNLRKAGLFLQRESQKVVPVDTGNLKSTAGTRQIGRDEHAVVAVFYDTNYAVYVHEMIQIPHKPGKQAKYLEGPAKYHRNNLLRIIAGQKPIP